MAAASKRVRGGRWDAGHKVFQRPKKMDCKSGSIFRENLRVPGRRSVQRQLSRGAIEAAHRQENGLPPAWNEKIKAKDA